MKRVFWTDSDGFRRCALLRDSDDETRPDIGIPLKPPDIDEILDNAKKKLYNELVDRGLFTYSDVVNSQNGLTAAILFSLRQDLIFAFKQKELGNV